MLQLGDGQADNPGYSAKYGTYSVIELTVVEFQLVQVYSIIVDLHFSHACNYHVVPFRVGGSYNMEKEGLERVIAFLQEMDRTSM